MEDEWNCLFQNKSIQNEYDSDHDLCKLNDSEPINYKTDLENYFSTFSMPLNEADNTNDVDPLFLHNYKQKEIKIKMEPNVETNDLNFMSFFNETPEPMKNESYDSFVPLLSKRISNSLIEETEDEGKITNCEYTLTTTPLKDDIIKSIDNKKEYDSQYVPSKLLNQEALNQENNLPPINIQITTTEEETLLNRNDSDEKGKCEEECVLTSQFINTVETMNNKISEQKESLQESIKELIAEIRNAKLEKQIDDVLQISKMNSESIQEFKDKSSSCIEQCKTFEISSEQLFAECVETLGYATLCYSEWVCLHSVDFNQLDKDLYEIKSFLNTFE